MASSRDVRDEAEEARVLQDEGGFYEEGREVVEEGLGEDYLFGRLVRGVKVCGGYVWRTLSIVCRLRFSWASVSLGWRSRRNSGGC